MVRKNKKGWTEVLEVFFSILLLIAILSLVLSKGVISDKGNEEKIIKNEIVALKIIQMNDTLRSDIINNQLTDRINESLNKTLLEELECKAKICVLNSDCGLENLPSKEVYVKSVLITNDLGNYDPKELELFCWEKG